MRRHLLFILLALQCTCLQAGAAEPETTPAKDDPAEVVVTGTRDPELMSYRHMLAGLDAFDSHHDMAPAAPALRFVLRPREYGTAIEGTTLNISWGDNSIPVPIARDGGFILPREPAAADGDADLMLNRKRGLYGVKAEVKTPGLPPNVLRLGDVRLECEVVVAISKHDLNFIKRAVMSTVLGSDWCMGGKFSYRVMAPKAFDNVAFVSGERRVLMQQGHHLQFFDARLGDTSWPNDTLLEFQFAAPATLALYTAQPIYLRGSMNNWGTTNELKPADADTFNVDIDLPKGKSEFRIASQDSHMINLGARGGKKQITDGHATLFWEGDKMTYDAPQAGRYRFSLNVTRPDEPEVSVAQVK